MFTKKDAKLKQRGELLAEALGTEVVYDAPPTLAIIPILEKLHEEVEDLKSRINQIERIM